MKKTFYLGKAFGPVASYAGQCIMLVGIVMLYHSYTALIMVFFGAFVGFSGYCTTIDFKRRRLRFCNNYFGLLKTGTWLPLEDGMSLALERDSATWRTWSRGNRILDIAVHDTRIVLLGRDGRMLMPLKIVGKKSSAQKELLKITQQLSLPVKP